MYGWGTTLRLTVLVVLRDGGTGVETFPWCGGITTLRVTVLVVLRDGGTGVKTLPLFWCGTLCLKFISVGVIFIL